MRARSRPEQDRHQRQEAEANAFAIELLAPRARTSRFLGTAPDLSMALALADWLEISREAASRRYVEHHGEPLAVVFSQNGRVRYIDVSDEFPALAVLRGHVLPDLPEPERSGLSRVEEADAADWLRTPGTLEITSQTLHQRDGLATTLLHVTDLSDDEEVEDTFVHLSDRGARS